MLPGEIVLHVASFADEPKDLVQLAAVSRRWRAVILGATLLWRNVNARFEVVDASRDGDLTSDRAGGGQQDDAGTLASNDREAEYRIFQRHAQMHGPFIHEFAKVSALSRRLLASLSYRIKETLMPPVAATPTRASGERTGGYVWEPDTSNPDAPSVRAQVALSLLFQILSEGQQRRESRIPGLFGTFQVYHQTTTMVLLTRAHIAKAFLNHSSATNTRANRVPQLIPFAQDSRGGEYLALVIEPNSPLCDHVVRFASADRDHPRMGVPADAFPYFSFGHILSSWLPDLVAALEQTNNWRRQRQFDTPILFNDSLYFRIDGPGTGVAVTDGIEVHVSTAFLFLPARFCYRITITRLPHCPHQSVQLWARHWRFTSRAGDISEISGEGVIGQFPILTPEQPSFQYRSQTAGGHEPDAVEDPVAIMEGQFSFFVGTIASSQQAADPAHRVPFDVAVPRVEFAYPSLWELSS